MRPQFRARLALECGKMWGLGYSGAWPLAEREVGVSERRGGSRGADDRPKVVRTAAASEPGSRVVGSDNARSEASGLGRRGGRRSRWLDLAETPRMQTRPDLEQTCLFVYLLPLKYSDGNVFIHRFAGGDS